MSNLPFMMRLWTVVALVLSGLSLGVAGSGWVPASGRSEVLPVTVRDNPGSWRPSYAGWSGWHSPSSTGGGGFGFGK